MFYEVVKSSYWFLIIAVLCPLSADGNGRPGIIGFLIESGAIPSVTKGTLPSPNVDSLNACIERGLIDSRGMAVGIGYSLYQLKKIEEDSFQLESFEWITKPILIICDSSLTSFATLIAALIWACVGVKFEIVTVQREIIVDPAQRKAAAKDAFWTLVTTILSNPTIFNGVTIINPTASDSYPFDQLQYSKGFLEILKRSVDSEATSADQSFAETVKNRKLKILEDPKFEEQLKDFRSKIESRKNALPTKGAIKSQIENDYYQAVFVSLGASSAEGFCSPGEYPALSLASAVMEAKKNVLISIDNGTMPYPTTGRGLQYPYDMMDELKPLVPIGNINLLPMSPVYLSDTEHEKIFQINCTYEPLFAFLNKGAFSPRDVKRIRKFNEEGVITVNGKDTVNWPKNAVSKNVRNEKEFKHYEVKQSRTTEYIPINNENAAKLQEKVFEYSKKITKEVILGSEAPAWD